MNTDLHELAPIYALDMLAVPEKAAFENHLRDCAQCQSEVTALSAVAADLAETASVDPPPSLKSRVLERVRGVPQIPGVFYHEGGVMVSRSDDIPWRETMPGVEVKRIYRDREKHYDTSLVRIAPGAVYPTHLHKDVEEIFILSGDLYIAGRKAGPGDYCRAEPDSLHNESFSESGCVFLVIASNRDEIRRS